MKQRFENEDKYQTHQPEFTIGRVVEPNGVSDDHYYKLTNKITILENENKQITENIDEKIIQLESLQTEFAKVKKLINSDLYGSNKTGIEFHNSNIFDHNLQNKNSFGGVSQISNDNQNF